MSLKHFEPGAILNKRYRIIKKLGEGGMGTVVEACRIADGAIVAIKYCPSHDLNYTKRFAREVRIMKAIEHPHVVRVLNTGLKHVPPYFVMPRAAGSLGTKLADYAADENSAIAAFLEFCEGVQAIHNAGAIHRDIKPDNALLIDGRVVVSDLGLAKLSDRDTTILTQTMAVVGTQMYLAPEQRLPAGSREADRRTDIFQLGKTLYQLITGSDPLLVDPDKLPAGIAHVVLKATQDHPDRRFQVVGELIDSIKVYQQAKDPQANPRGAFEAVMGQINERLEREEYRGSDIQRLLAILANPAVYAVKDHYLELFDRIPSKVLQITAEEFEGPFLPVLRGYVEAIDDQVGGRAFSYAEVVAKKMEPIFRSKNTSATIKALALEAVLIAGVRLGRFAAIDSFNAMLTAVSDDDAFEVRDMLERRGEYGDVCEKVPAVKLHPVIRAIRDKLAGVRDAD